MAMAAATKKRTAAGEMSHPTRVQILEIANARPISASRFVEDVLGISVAEEPEDYKRALSHVSYHFGGLRDAGCIEVADLIKRRGTFERLHIGTMRAQLDEDEWGKLSEDEKTRITTIIWQGLVARTESARLARTIDSRDKRTVAWTAALLDEQGTDDLLDLIIESYAGMERIREESEARREETGEKGIPTTYAMLGFESPPAR
jgi:DNA-binding transcriptional ArsR family regulator